MAIQKPKVRSDFPNLAELLEQLETRYTSKQRRSILLWLMAVASGSQPQRLCGPVAVNAAQVFAILLYETWDTKHTVFTAEEMAVLHKVLHYRDYHLPPYSGNGFVVEKPDTMTDVQWEQFLAKLN